MVYEKGLIRVDRGQLIDKGNYAFDPAHPDFAGGADTDGLKDASRAFVDCDTEAFQWGASVRPAIGVYRIARNITLKSGWDLPEGVVIRPDNGVTITFNGPFNAGSKKSFDTSAGGSIVFGAGAVDRVLPQWWGVRGDGETDDTDGLRAAAAAARDAGVPLEIAAGLYLVTGEVTFYTDIVCHGEIVLRSGTNNARIVVDRTQTGEPIDPNGLSGLTRGSTRITGLTGRAGQTVRLASTETLIERAGSDAYTKNEVVYVLNDEGDIWPPLDCTYNSTQNLTVTAYPAEPLLSLNGLRITVEDPGSNNSMLLIRRSWVRIDGLELEVVANRQNGYIGVDVRDAVGTFFVNPRIAGLQHSGLGYAIHAFCAAYTVVQNGDIRESRRAFSGRHSHEVHIDGGFYSSHLDLGALDNHWCNGFYVRNATIHASQAASRAMSIAGSNVVVSNCRVQNCRGIAVIRGDTPELMGYFIARDNVIEWPAGPSGFVLGIFPSGSGYTGVFSRTLSWPDYVEIANNTIINPGVSDSYFWRDPGTVFDRTQVGELYIANNAVIGEGIRKVATLEAFQVRSEFAANADPIIRIHDQRLSGTDDNALRIGGVNPDAQTYKYNVDIQKSGPFKMRLRADACRSFKVQRSTILAMRGLDSDAQTPAFAVELYECDLGDGSSYQVYRSAPQLEYHNCRFTAVMTYSVDPAGIELHTNRVQATRASFANRAVAGLNLSALPPLDAYVDPSAYVEIEASGTATVPNGQTTVNVNHGLSRAPDLADISVTPIDDMGDATKFWVSNPTATTFTLHVDVDPGASGASFAWQARIA